MSDEPNRFQVIEEEGVPHGGLYELEQTTTFRVVDTRSGETVLTFHGEMEASLSTSTGTWDDYTYRGVVEVAIAPGGRSAVVTYHDGREERVALPE